MNKCWPQVYSVSVAVSVAVFVANKYKMFVRDRQALHDSKHMEKNTRIPLINAYLGRFASIIKLFGYQEYPWFV
jgi:hypothetical protein